LPTSDSAVLRAAYSLTSRLAVALALILAVGGVAVALAALAYGRSAAQQSFDRLLTGAANQIAESLYLRDGEVRVDLPVSAFELLALAPEDRVVYAVVDGSGALITGYGGLAAPDGGADFYSAEFAAEPVRVAQVVRTFAERSYAGQVAVRVGQTLRAREQLAAQITRNALIAAGLAGLLMSALALFAVRSALRPLRRIESDIAARAVQDLTPIEVATPREIETLVASLNRFMTRLDRQFAVMRTLIADASHQLRTPIAALRAQAELAADETDPDRLQAIVARIHARSLGLSRLTDQLLSHALIIHRAETVPLEPIDLRTVAIRAVEETDHAFFSRRTRPRLDLPEDEIWCRGDMLSLVEACKNLLGNALRHGAEPVTLAAEDRGGDVRLTVRDAGAGLPEAHWRDAGSRYARESGVSSDSAGLGLAIVQAVAAAHGGEMRFSRTPKGFEAAIVMPPCGAPNT
jgi:two-component system sensor histidine kinase TctE